MKLLYVDDSPQDLNLVSMLFRKDRNISVQGLSSLSDAMNPAIDLDGADCVLVDVMRPDSLSLEEDISTLRGHCDTPLVFVTGGDPAELRMRAVQSGADALLEKSSLSRDLILQVVANAASRRSRVSPVIDDIHKDAMPELDSLADAGFSRLHRDSVRTDLLIPAAAALQKSLDELHAFAAQGVNVIHLADQLKAGSRLASGMSAVLNQDISALENVDARKLCGAIQREVEEIGKNVGVAVLWDIESTPYMQIGGAGSGLEALRQLICGMIGLMRRGSSLLVTGVKSDEPDGAEISIYATGLRLPQGWLAGPDSTPDAPRPDPIPLEALSSLTLALSLFGVAQEQIQHQQIGDTAVLSIHL